jgi:hypothetical protein
MKEFGAWYAHGSVLDVDANELGRKLDDAGLVWIEAASFGVDDDEVDQAFASMFALKESVEREGDWPPCAWAAHEVCTGVAAAVRADVLTAHRFPSLPRDVDVVEQDAFHDRQRSDEADLLAGHGRPVKTVVTSGSSGNDDEVGVIALLCLRQKLTKFQDTVFLLFFEGCLQRYDT